MNAPVAVVNQSITHLTSMQCLLECIQQRIRLHGSTDSSAHDVAGKDVDDKSHMDGLRCGPLGARSDDPVTYLAVVAAAASNHNRLQLSAVRGLHDCKLVHRGVGAQNPQEVHPQAIGRHVAEWIAEIERPGAPLPWAHGSDSALPQILF